MVANDYGRKIMRKTREVPKLNEEKSVSVIPADYWKLNCWT